MESDTDIKSGSLMKKEAKGKAFKWSQYYFVLANNQTFYWFKSSKDIKKKSKAKGSIALANVAIRYPDLNPPETQNYCFQIVTPDNVVHAMSASSENEVTDWVDVLKTAIYGKGDLNKQAVLIQDKLKKTGHDIPPEDLDFDDSGVIGSGASGVVKKGMWLKSTQVAVKALKNLPEFTDQKELISFYKEIETLSKLRHSEIVQMYGFCKKGEFTCLVTEYVKGGNLQEALLNKDKYPLNLNLQIELAQSIARGMVYLHNQGVIHRDLKPANILIENWETAKLKVCDFGLSRVVKKQDAQMTTDTLGSPQYAAPELNSETHTNSVDVFSFGIILWEICTRLQPWPELKFGWQFADKYHKGERMELPREHPLSSLIDRCWAQDPNQRPTFTQVYTELEDARKKLNTPQHPNLTRANTINYFPPSKSVTPPPQSVEQESFYMTGNVHTSNSTPNMPSIYSTAPSRSPNMPLRSPPPISKPATPPIQEESFYLSTGAITPPQQPRTPPTKHVMPPPFTKPGSTPPQPERKSAPVVEESFYLSTTDVQTPPPVARPVATPPTRPNSQPPMKPPVQEESFYLSPGTVHSPPPTTNGPPTGYASPGQLHGMMRTGSKPSLREVMTTSPSPSVLPPNTSHYATPAQLQNSRTHSVPPPVQSPVLPPSPKPSSGIEDKFVKLFGAKPKESWMNISKLLRETMNATPNQLTEIKYLFDDGGTVDKAIWDHFLLWFTPLVPDRTKEGFDLTTIVDIVKPTWFHGFLSSADAQAKLRGFADGSFLLRFSTATAGYYALSVSYAGIVGHWRIQSVKEPGQAVKFIFDDREFQTLLEIVNTYSKGGRAEPLRIKNPKPGQPSTILLTDPFNRAEQYYQNIH